MDLAAIRTGAIDQAQSRRVDLIQLILEKPDDPEVERAILEVEDKLATWGVPDGLWMHRRGILVSPEDDSRMISVVASHLFFPEAARAVVDHILLFAGADLIPNVAQEAIRANIGSKPSEWFHYDEIEQFLAAPERKITGRRVLPGGFTREVTLDNGVRAIWKSLDPEVLPYKKVPPSKHEVAAYRIDKAMGHFAGVPPAVYREFDGESGVLLYKVPDVVDGSMPGIFLDDIRACDPKAYQRLAEFDGIISNWDRSSENYVIPRDDLEFRGERISLKPRARIIPIDNTESFDSRYRLDYYSCELSPSLSADARQALEQLVAKREEVARQLEPYLAPAFIGAMWKRVDAMLEHNLVQPE